MTAKLIYIGKGSAFIGAPMRDLTEQDIAERGLDETALIESGLYESATASSIDFIQEEPKVIKAPKKGKAKKEGE